MGKWAGLALQDKTLVKATKKENYFFPGFSPKLQRSPQNEITVFDSKSTTQKQTGSLMLVIQELTSKLPCKMQERQERPLSERWAPSGSVLHSNRLIQRIGQIHNTKTFTPVILTPRIGPKMMHRLDKPFGWKRNKTIIITTRDSAGYKSRGFEYFA